MVVIITTSNGVDYNQTMQLHQEKLNNLERYGRVQTDKEIELQVNNIPEPQPMKIHGIYPTIYNYGSSVMYTTIVCFEPIVEEKEEEKEESYKPEVRIS